MDLQEDMITMKEGRVMRVQNGEMLPLDEEISMLDGTRIQPDGTLLLTDGTTRTMTEGETLRIPGKMVETAEMPDIGSTEETTGTETHDPS